MNPQIVPNAQEQMKNQNIAAKEEHKTSQNPEPISDGPNQLKDLEEQE